MFFVPLDPPGAARMCRPVSLALAAFFASVASVSRRGASAVGRPYLAPRAPADLWGNRPPADQAQRRAKPAARPRTRKERRTAPRAGPTARPPTHIGLVRSPSQ